EHSTGLPVSVNGSFYPKPDRKRIRLGDGHAESLWNEAIIARAAELLASRLAELAESVGDAWVIDLLRKAHDLHTRSVNSVEPIHRVWWTSLAQWLQTAAVVPTQAGSRGTTSSVW